MRRRNASITTASNTPTTNRQRLSSSSSSSTSTTKPTNQPSSSSSSRGRMNQRKQAASSPLSRSNSAIASKVVSKNTDYVFDTRLPNLQLSSSSSSSSAATISANGRGNKTTPTASARKTKLSAVARSSSSSTSSSVGSHVDNWSDSSSVSSVDDGRTLTTTTLFSSSSHSTEDNNLSSSSSLSSSALLPLTASLHTPGALANVLPTALSSGASLVSPTENHQLLLEQPTTKRWRDWWLRFTMTLVMISTCFAYIYITKQPGVVLMVFVLQGLIYRELITIALNDSKERDMPGFRFFYYYWFFVYAYFMYIRTTYKYIISGIRGIPVDDVLENPSSPPHIVPTVVTTSLSSTVSESDPTVVHTTVTDIPLNTSTDNSFSNPTNEPSILLRIIEYLVTRYEPITFVLFIIGFVAFVISLRQRRNFRYQFSQLAYCHMALLLVVVQSTYLAANVFHGLLWFFLPCGLVVANDSFAYVAGFFFGRTPLIRLSPKKTVEGFIGGGIATVFYALISTHLYSTLEWGDTKYLMTCPVENGIGWQINHCDTDIQTSHLYKAYPLQDWSFGYLFPLYFQNNFYLSRMQVHAVALSLFASVVAPFGGFFASGFKRAFKIKDFGTSIPGHGGFTDRMDCQLIMATFAYIYGVYVLDLGQSTELVPHYLSFLKRHLNEDDLKLLYQALGQYLLALPSHVPQQYTPSTNSTFG